MDQAPIRRDVACNVSPAICFARAGTGLRPVQPRARFRPRTLPSCHPEQAAASTAKPPRRRRIPAPESPAALQTPRRDSRPRLSGRAKLDGFATFAKSGIPRTPPPRHPEQVAASTAKPKAPRTGIPREPLSRFPFRESPSSFFLDLTFSFRHKGNRRSRSMYL